MLLDLNSQRLAQHGFGLRVPLLQDNVAAQPAEFRRILGRLGAGLILPEIGQLEEEAFPLCGLPQLFVTIDLIAHERLRHGMSKAQLFADPLNGFPEERLSPGVFPSRLIQPGHHVLAGESVGVVCP